MERLEQQQQQQQQQQLQAQQQEQQRQLQIQQQQQLQVQQQQQQQLQVQQQQQAHQAAVVAAAAAKAAADAAAAAEAADRAEADANTPLLLTDGHIAGLQTPARKMAAFEDVERNHVAELDGDEVTARGVQDHALWAVRRNFSAEEDVYSNRFHINGKLHGTEVHCDQATMLPGRDGHVAVVAPPTGRRRPCRTCRT